MKEYFESPEQILQDHYLLKEYEKRKILMKKLKNLLSYMIVLIVSLCFCFVIISTFHPICVSGDSMNPTLYDGEILECKIVDEISDLNYNDIIIFKHGIVKYVKRVIGLPGDTLYVIDGVVYRNGEALDEPYDKIVSAGMLSEPYTVEENHVFAMGDNRNNSSDCREFGAVHMNIVREKMIKKIKLFEKRK